MRLFLLLLSLPLLAQADPLCLPKQAGGAGTEAIHRLVYMGGAVSENPDDARANGGTMAAGGKAVTWWCPREVFGGFIVYDLEWYGWEFAQDQALGMIGFRVDDPETVRQAWHATRVHIDPKHFPTQVLIDAAPSRPKTKDKKVRP